jgi:carbon monoxide dehydrogenase subunit G
MKRMTTTVSMDIGYEFDVKASATEVFEVLADVPTSATFYPKVQQLVDLGKGTYRWEMEKIGVGQVTLQTLYTSTYVSNKAKGTVTWTPVSGEGNAEVAGSWKISDKKTHTHVVLQVKADIALPVPALMKVVLTPVLTAELEHLTEQYIDNLCKRFGGEV